MRGRYRMARPLQSFLFHATPSVARNNLRGFTCGVHFRFARPFKAERKVGSSIGKGSATLDRLELAGASGPLPSARAAYVLAVKLAGALEGEVGFITIGAARHGVALVGELAALPCQSRAPARLGSTRSSMMATG